MARNGVFVPLRELIPDSLVIDCDLLGKSPVWLGSFRRAAAAGSNSIFWRPSDRFVIGRRSRGEIDPEAGNHLAQDLRRHRGLP
jgi:hypothetical protein